MRTRRDSSKYIAILRTRQRNQKENKKGQFNRHDTTENKTEKLEGQTEGTDQ